MSTFLLVGGQQSDDEFGVSTVIKIISARLKSVANHENTDDAYDVIITYVLHLSFMMTGSIGSCERGDTSRKNHFDKLFLDKSHVFKPTASNDSFKTCDASVQWKNNQCHFTTAITHNLYLTFKY